MYLINLIAVSIFTIMMISGLLSESLTINNGDVFAHRDGCHRWHSCPSDSGSYVCGDLGYDSQCSDKQDKSSSSKGESEDKNDNTKQMYVMNIPVESKECSKGYHKDPPVNVCISDKKKQTKLNSNALSTIATNNTASTKCQGLADCFDGTVTEVVDGDTLDVNNVRIRLALVDAPEISEIGYLEAKEFVEVSCGVGTQAKVDEDDGQKGGSFGRMIAVVYCGNQSISINQALLDSGHGTVFQEFCSVSEFATDDWPVKYCSTNEPPIELSTENTVKSIVTDPEVVTETEQTGDCDSSYPDFCISSPPPDLDCGEISQKRFTVSGSDPHGFDRDGDRVGCES